MTAAATAALGPITQDHFLGGRLVLRQPRDGYRAGTDPLLLAAACRAEPGQSVLDLGCGVGAAGLCLAARVPDLDLHGLEAQERYADLARQNAASANLRATIHLGDLTSPPAALRELSFDHVILNPPYHAPDTPASPRLDRDLANRESATNLAAWIDTALKRLKPQGEVTLIHRAERTVEILAALSERSGDIRLLPLQARANRPAKRVVLRARKGARGPFGIAPPFIIHAGPQHLADTDDFTEEMEQILRHAQPLAF
jgi:tRNA1(Val) A37 N6-methylase TrmN6